MNNRPHLTEIFESEPEEWWSIQVGPCEGNDHMELVDPDCHIILMRAGTMARSHAKKIEGSVLTSVRIRIEREEEHDEDR